MVKLREILERRRVGPRAREILEKFSKREYLFELDDRGVIYLTNKETGMSELRVCRVPVEIAEEIAKGKKAILDLRTAVGRGPMIRGPAPKPEQAYMLPDLEGRKITVVSALRRDILVIENVPRFVFDNLDRFDFGDITVSVTR